MTLNLNNGERKPVEQHLQSAGRTKNIILEFYSQWKYPSIMKKKIKSLSDKENHHRKC